MPQPRNSEHIGLQRADTMGRRKSSIPRPIEGFGIWNGDFELGDPHDADSPNPYQPDGWAVTLLAGGSIERVAGGVSGNYCMRGGQAGVGAGGQLVTNDYFPVDETREYYISCAVWSSNVAATFSLGVRCYDAAKAYLGSVWPLNTVATPLAPVRRQMRIGPLGDVAWPATTRYCKVTVILQQNAALAAWVYVDDIQFRQLTATYSPQITYTSDTADATGSAQNFTLQAYIQHVGSIMNLTLEEPGRIWVWYYWSAMNDIGRPTICYATLYINAAAQTCRLRVGGAGSVYVPGALSFQSPIVARGAYIIDVRFWVAVLGDTTEVRDLRGECYYVRAY